MPPSQLIFRLHALQGMAERQITVDDVQAVLASGEEIESYPQDQPYPGRLVLGWRGQRPLHVVAAEHFLD
jgi:hypothetical protein